MDCLVFWTFFALSKDRCSPYRIYHSLDRIGADSRNAVALGTTYLGSTSSSVQEFIIAYIVIYFSYQYLVYQKRDHSLETILPELATEVMVSPVRLGDAL